MQAAPCSSKWASDGITASEKRSLRWCISPGLPVGANAYVIPSHARLEKEINKAPVSTCHSEELQELCEARGSTIITGTHTVHPLR